MLALPDELNAAVASLFLNEHDHRCLPRLASTCKVLRELFRMYAEQAKRRCMRWIPCYDNTLSADGTVVVLNEQGRAPGALFITALANRLPMAGRSVWTVHIEKHPHQHGRRDELLLCLCDANGHDVGILRGNLPSRSAVTFTYDATAGTLGFGVLRPNRVRIPTVLRAEFDNSPIAAHMATILDNHFDSFVPVAVSLHLTIKPQYAEQWSDAIRRFVATVPPLIVGTHADEKRVRELCPLPATIRISPPQPRYEVSTAFATDLGHSTLLDALEPIANVVAFNAILDAVSPERVVLLPDALDVERLVFASDAPFTRAITPDGVYHTSYSPQPRYPGHQLATLRGVALRPCAQLNADDRQLAGDRVRIDGWLREDPGQEHGE